MINSELKIALLENYSAKGVRALAQRFCDNDKALEELFTIALRDKGKAQKAAAWTLQKIASDSPQYLRKFEGKMLSILSETVEANVGRAILAYFKNGIFDASSEALLYDYCSIIAHSDRSIAERAFSIYCMLNVVKRNPLLKNEFIQFLEMTKAESSGMESCLRRAFTQTSRV